MPDMIMNKEDKFNNSDSSGSTFMEELRQIRKDANRLNSSVVDHLKAFQWKDDSFKTLPSSEDPDISVGSTCTAVMALLATKRHKQFLSKATQQIAGSKVDFASLFKRIVNAKWDSSGLPDGNPFTIALAARTAGFVVSNKIMSDREVAALTHDRYSTKNEEGIEQVDETVAGKTLEQIIQHKASQGGDSFAVSGYPAKSTIVYWFLDGAITAKIKLGEHLKGFALWATREFHRQLIYVSAGNDFLMDPPELAMAACLINRIHRLCNEDSELAEISRSLPSQVELTFAIDRVLTEQPRSGIWHKYFPLFHFPRGRGAADYCFTFEFLEAVLTEFGSTVLRTPESVEHFRRSLIWCEKHLLHFVKSQSQHYRGWNSGGEVRKLAAGMPECWATASVHMFLNQLDHAINNLLDELVLQKFGFDRLATVKSRDKFKGLIDIPINFPNEPPTTLLKVLESELLCRALQWKPADDWRLDVPRSALFFGPPGTSKTNLAKSIAAYLGWPIIIITPSKFLSKGLEQIHAQVDEIFCDLMDLQKAVVFFDEMDALAQTREEDPEGEKRESLDVTRQLLTTSMLPKLADLWDHAKVIFLMATNHKQRLDPAITRANRFDLLLCVAPPLWTDKRSGDKLERILGITNSSEVEKELKKLVKEASPAEKLLDRFTVSELGIFFDHFRRITGAKNLLEALGKCEDSCKFSEIVTEWAKNGIALREGTLTKIEYDEDIQGSRRQYYDKDIPQKAGSPQPDAASLKKEELKPQSEDRNSSKQ